MELRSEIGLRGEETGGRVSVIQITVPAGWPGPPLHHHDFDEAFYVLEGELTFALADRLVTAGPGAFAFAPRGVHHTLANRSAAAARYLLICTPAGFERRFEAEPAGPAPETIMIGDPIGTARPADAALPGPAPGPLRILLHGAESGEVVGIVDNDLPGGTAGPYLHSHGFDEAFCVLAGTPTFQLGDRLTTARAGDVVFAPRGVAHTFTNRDGDDARMLIVMTEAGFERVFARRAAERAGVEPPAWADGPVPPVTREGPRIG